jgi:hypothetical protein
MGLHDPFGYLKHKLWPKEWPGVKLAIWFLTTESCESFGYTCVKVACHILLESSWWGIQICFRPHFNQRFEKTIYGLSKLRESQFWEFQDSQLGSPEIKRHLGQALWLGIKNNIRGKVAASPKSGSWWVLWVCVCLWFVHALKVFQLCTNQLVVWFVQVRVNNWFTCHSS